MKNTIIKYGLISGGVLATLLLVVTLITKQIGYEKIGFENSAYIGYSTMLVSMAVIYFGIKSFREQTGSLTFGKGFLIGLGIMAIACVMYSLMWLVVYYNFIPTFIEDYTAFAIQKAKASGASDAEMAQTLTGMNQMKEWYKNPLLIFAMTLVEPLPVGILVSLVSAWVLRRTGFQPVEKK